MIEILENNAYIKDEFYEYAMTSLATRLQREGKGKVALAYLNKLLTHSEEKKGKTSPRYFLTLQEIAIVTFKLNRYAEAINILELTLSKLDTLGESEIFVANILSTLSTVYFFNRDPQKAIETLEKSLQIYEKRSNTIGIYITKSKLASFLYKNHEYIKALELQLAVVKLSILDSGLDNFKTVSALATLGFFYYELNNNDTSTRLFELIKNLYQFLDPSGRNADNFMTKWSIIAYFHRDVEASRAILDQVSSQYRSEHAEISAFLNTLNSTQPPSKLSFPKRHTIESNTNYLLKLSYFDSVDYDLEKVVNICRINNPYINEHLFSMKYFMLSSCQVIMHSNNMILSEDDVNELNKIQTLQNSSYKFPEINSFLESLDSY